MAVSTVPSGTNVLSTSPSVGNFQQFSRPGGVDKYFDGKNSLGQVGKIAQINANVEVDALLKGLDFHTVITKGSKPASASWCSRGIIGGLAASLFTKSPFPFLMGICECFPRVRAQQKVGTEFQVNTYTTDLQKWPSVTSLNNGTFIVTWGGAGVNDSFGVYGQLFNDNGSKVGREFQINTYTSGIQNLPSVASVDSGNLVVIWNSVGQDGSGWGIFGQMFDGNATKIGSEFQINTYTLRARKEIT